MSRISCWLLLVGQVVLARYTCLHPNAHPLKAAMNTCFAQQKRERTTITASRYRARASRPSAPLLWLRSIFLMAHPLLRLRAIALALRALLCEEGNMTHSSSVQTATSSRFGCGFAALCLFCTFPECVKVGDAAGDDGSRTGTHARARESRGRRRSCR